MVEFVRDQNYAEVHLFFTRQTNGSGGSEYVIDFIGQKNFKDLQDQIKFSTDSDMTSDDVRSKILKFVKLGLVRYWVKKGSTKDISVTIAKPEEGETTKDSISDPWDYWVFGTDIFGYFSGEESSKFSSFSVNVTSKRVTEANKFSFRAGFSENQSTFSFDGTDIISKRNSKYLYISDIISISDHWSTGAFANIGSSMYSNKEFYWEFKPAIEYNFFNYSVSAKKQLALTYSNGIVYNNYIQRSVYAKENEYLWEHELKLGGSVNQKWGNIYGEASFEQYLHDTSLNALTFYLGTSIRLFKGLNFNLSGNYSITRNQINLPAGDVSLEELLLQQQQLQSGYNYYFNVGLSYSFGSIYNTIVNPRFNF
ncbi:hypothetical protein BXY82_0775 [Gelidibacter sediminis]|uniref:Uncharacterized protein n=1 Tax=Gelidibacter sediminis TaxID=1608710 RepID=A0A4R7Q762_9FLAO|nr:hypothetical protein [Gelidibacter sediminis]TDU43364.1 hypothetical protein BXY82_0775 [Gelidibacter sediminis]